MLRAALVAFTALAGSAQADPPLACEGYDPDWFLTLAGPVAQLRYLRKTDFEIPQHSVAEGKDWPRAYTLVAEFDTAIVLIDKDDCKLGDQTWPIKAHVLTQRGQTPILLSGCCTVAE